MKREKFLWPLTQGHHGALLAAKKIREKLSKIGEGDKPALEALGREVTEIFQRDLEPHFRGEERELLPIFAGHAGAQDEGVRKIREDHETLRALARSAVKADLQRFADGLTAHVRYEEEVFFPRVEQALTEGEKAVEAEKLEAYKPCPLKPG